MGVRYLVVGGTVVVDEGKIVPDVFPGRALLGPGKLLLAGVFELYANSASIFFSARSSLVMRKLRT